MHSRFLTVTIILAAGLAGLAAEAQQGNSISVPVSGLRNNNGNVRCGLFNSAATFPKDGQQFMGVVAPIANQQATCVFNNVPPGTYAVSLFHAEKGETQLRTGFFGQPEEGYGFSRNAKGSMGPPAFNAAAYTYSGGATSWPVTITYP
jgi:uncharacterized protein (DUF2141 family)